MQDLEIRYHRKVASGILLFFTVFCVIWLLVVLFSQQSLLNKMINGITFIVFQWIIYRSWRKMAVKEPVVIINKEGILKFNGNDYDRFRWEAIIRAYLLHESGEGNFLCIVTNEQTHRISLNWIDQKREDIEAAIKFFREKR